MPSLVQPSPTTDCRAMHPLLEAAVTEIDRAAGGLAPDILARPLAGRWSIAEILEHLTLAFTLNRAAVEKALASGAPRARPPGLRQRLGRLLVVDIGYFPRVMAPEATRPTGAAPPGQSLGAVRAALVALDDTLTRAAARFGDVAEVGTHPYFGGLTVPQWRKFHWRHTRHHMRQVRVRAGAQGPRSAGP